MRKSFISIILILGMVLTACGSESNTSTPSTKEDKQVAAVESTKEKSNAGGTAKKIKKPNFTTKTYPRIDGSTATIPLSEAMASELLNMSTEDTKNFVKHNTTHNAYLSLIEGSADIIFVTEPSKEELKLAEDANVELEIIPVVKEGFVFIVNTANTVKSLDAKEIKDIYQGKITSWKEVGGKDIDIIPYQRDSNSGSQTLMEQIVMKGLTIMDAPKNVVMDMAGLIDRVAKYDNAENALGYSVYYYAKTMYNKDTIRLLAVDGVMPDNKSIASGKYPFSTAYYAVIKKKEPKDTSARKLLDWILSEDGQKLAEEAGYVPLEVK